jgi:DNA-binding beta-propeller fold protein YncE
MTHINVAIRPALEWAVMIACLALCGDLTMAATASSDVYTLPLGDSPSSYVNGVFFDGKYIWAAVQNPDGGVLVKLSTSGQTLATVGVGSGPDKIAFDGTNIWVTDYASSALTVVAENGNVVATIPLAPSANPEGILFDGKYIWVANNGGGLNSVSKFDISTRTLIGTYQVGLAPDAVAFDGTNIWVANTYNNNVWVIDRTTGAYLASYTTGSITVPLFPTGVIYDGTNIWVANGTGVNIGTSGSQGISSVSKIRPADGTILGTYTVGHLARDLVYDGTSIWVCNANDNTVSRLRAADVALLGTYPTGIEPRAIAFDGSKIWVADSGQNTLTIIAPQAGAGSSQGISGVTPAVVTQQAVGTVPGVGAALNVLLDN